MQLLTLRNTVFATCPLAFLLAGFLSNASSPIVKPRAGESLIEVAQPPLPALNPGCKRVLSEEYSASVERPDGQGNESGCAAAQKGEQERRITQSELDCLMNGFETSTQIRMACTRITQRSPKGPIAALHFDARWRCYRTQCTDAP